MRTLIVAAVSGLLFGSGLIMSDMANPARVIAFLDVTGVWDPTLGFVMAGALIPMSMAWALVRWWGSRSLLGDVVAIPKGTPVTARLVLGSVLFGAGWGLVGLCPGPAIVGLGIQFGSVWPFVLAMLVGMMIWRIVIKFRVKGA
jgi:uncharacterized membrane protein YedE/YeeE